MSFIRPEAARLLTRWRETLIGTAAALLGLWWLATTAGALWLFGLVLAPGGALLALAGIQRARFRGAAAAPGVVELVEGQLGYFGPHDGGVIDIAAIRRVDVVRDRAGAAFWVLHAAGAPPLAIPAGAAGADALFDALAALPGLRPERIAAAPGEAVPVPRTLWRRDPAEAPAVPAPATRRLH